MKKTIGILAHVDAGKTTFSEQVLFRSHATKHLGRVDHQDTFLDTDPMEQRRGITIYSGLAVLTLGDDTIYWIDTPGHSDFSAEMERSLSVMDAAVLIISAAEGIQSHTETLWRLLENYSIPVIMFLNKSDREGADPDAVLKAMRNRFSPDLIDLRKYQALAEPDDEFVEAVAEHSEDLLDSYLAGNVDEMRWIDTLSQLTMQRKAFPVMSGSALRGDGIERFLEVMNRLVSTSYSSDLPVGGKVFRVRRDRNGQRLSFMKLTAGMLRVRESLHFKGEQYKINEIRIVHGDKSSSVPMAEAGDIIAVPGLDALRPGDGFGSEAQTKPTLLPMTAVTVTCEQATQQQLVTVLRILEDEDPSLSVNASNGIVTVRVMGMIQMEVLSEQLSERFGLKIEYGPRKVLYRETVAAPVIGIGHYEPLRHYAEVWLRLSPAEPGSSVAFRSLAHVDDLSLNWQRLIETHVMEKEHRGVLTGSPLTDVCIELLCGRAHLKHTEGGDFRQAVYRAIRQGLMQAENILLEPICGFEMIVPSEQYGALSSILRRIHAECEPAEYISDRVILKGEAPYALFAAWQDNFTMLTHGKGSLRVWSSRYAPCHNAEEVIRSVGYQPLAYPEDTPDSVFCSHGAGTRVPWDQVRQWAHCRWEEI